VSRPGQLVMANWVVASGMRQWNADEVSGERLKAIQPFLKTPPPRRPLKWYIS